MIALERPRRYSSAGHVGGVDMQTREACADDCRKRDACVAALYSSAMPDVSPSFSTRLVEEGPILVGS
jgi:hypothetical protein